MTASNYLVTQYPLTTNYIERFTERLGVKPEQIVISNITAGGYLDVLGVFRALKVDTLYLPVVDETGRVLLPLLKVLCLFSRARDRFVVEPDFSTRGFGWGAGLFGVLMMGGGFVHGALTLLWGWIRLGRLLRAPRIAVAGHGAKRVLYLKTNLWLGVQAGGAVAHTNGVIGGMLGKGYGVDFASAETPVALPHSENLEIRPIKPPRSYVIPREMNHYRHNDNFIRTVLDMPAERYGFIYQRHSQGNFTGVVVSRRWKRPLVMEYNGSELWIARNWGRPLFFERLAEMAETACLRHAHLVVTVSDVLRDEVIARGVEPERVVACPNGVDPTVFDPKRYSPPRITEARRHFGIPRDAVVVTFVGTFGHWHGAEVLAGSLREIAVSDPQWLADSKIHVVFVGDGVKRPLVEETVSDPRLAPYCTITGLIAPEDTPLLMAASDILVSPHIPNPDSSPFFGSPTKLFEYLASGRPVIASNLYQIGEVLRGASTVGSLSPGAGPPGEEQCGILVTPGDTGELAAAVRFLVENPQWRQAAGRNARKRALAFYTWDHHVETILGGLQAVLARDAQRPLRLLFNGLHSKSGGGITYLHNVLPLLAEDPGIEVHLCLHEEQRDLLPANLDNVTVHFLSFKTGFWRLQINEQRELPRLSRRIGADVTFSPANYGPFLARNSVILVRNALSVVFVERRPVKLAYWAMVYLGTALSLLFCSRAIAVSDYARRSLGEVLLRLARGRISVIPHGVGEIFSPPAESARREGFLLAVSDIYVQKNLRNLLYAVARLRATHPGVVLKVAGRPIDEDYYQSLKKIVAEEGLEPHVEFLGEVSPTNLADLYHRCAVFVFPSSVETFGNPLVEAMACGAPIASSNTAAMPEVLGEAALYFDPADVEDMASTLSRLLMDAGMRRDIGKRALARSRDFSWRKTVDMTLEVIKQAARP